MLVAGSYAGEPLLPWSYVRDAGLLGHGNWAVVQSDDQDTLVEAIHIPRGIMSTGALRVTDHYAAAC